jgi:(p)ppGpp synthase/HD superfamily hydrolase
MQAELNNEKIMNFLIVEAILTKSASKGLDIELIENAHRFAEGTVGDRLRESDGTSFIGHFIRVPGILALELEVADSEIIASGFLHALVAHTDVTYQMLEEKFGKRISDLIALWTLRSEDDQKHRDLIQRLEESPEKQAALVKLSDRLDNTRRLRFADRPGKREQYIRQTENLYLPFAKKTNGYVYHAFRHTLEKLKARQYD